MTLYPFKGTAESKAVFIEDYPIGILTEVLMIDTNIITNLCYLRKITYGVCIKSSTYFEKVPVSGIVTIDNLESTSDAWEISKIYSISSCMTMYLKKYILWNDLIPQQLADTLDLTLFLEPRGP